MTRVSLNGARRLLVALWLCMLAGPLAARDVSGLYNASVAVKDRSPAERSRASAAALAEVLVKLTGNRRTPNDASARPLLGRASTLPYFAELGGRIVLVTGEETNVDEADAARRSLQEAGLPHIEIAALAEAVAA